MGILLIVLPFLLDFPEGAPTTIPIVLGVGTILYSLLTDYELGAYKAIPMKTHLIIDLVAGAFLIVSPWLFDFDDLVLWPFVILGIVEIVASLMTEKHTKTYAENPRHNGAEKEHVETNPSGRKGPSDKFGKRDNV